MVILPKDIEEWTVENEAEILLRCQVFWANLKGMEPTENTHTVTIDIPHENRFNSAALEHMMNQINEMGEL